DSGINELFEKMMVTLREKTGVAFGQIAIHPHDHETTTRSQIIPPKRVRYLSEIADNNRAYDAWVEDQAMIASKLYQLH
ncbi:hypothetical protein ABTE84_21380, partial [Acinetobacter baumannii]